MTQSARYTTAQWEPKDWPLTYTAARFLAEPGHDYGDRQARFGIVRGPQHAGMYGLLERWYEKQPAELRDAMAAVALLAREDDQKLLDMLVAHEPCIAHWPYFWNHEARLRAIQIGLVVP